MNLAPTSHHPLGPSQWPAWDECAFFDAEEDLDSLDTALALTADDPAIDFTDAKARGRVMHEVLATILSGNRAAIAEALPRLSEREKGYVEWSAAKIIETAGIHGFSPAEIRTERRVSYYRSETAIEPDFYGTIDGDSGPAIIYDAKYGDFRSYFAQMAGYALAKMDESDGAVKSVLAVVVFGRLRRVVTYVITRELAEIVAFKVMNRRNNRAAYAPKLCQYCGWCKHRSSCDAVLDPVNTISVSRLGFPIPAHPSRITDPTLLGVMRYVWGTYVKPWGESVEYHTKAVAESGIIPLGFTKRPRKGSKDVRDAEKAIHALRAAGVPDDALVGLLSVSVGALVKAYQKSMGVGEKKAEAAVIEILTNAKLLSYGEAGFSLNKEPDAEETLRAALARGVAPLTPTDALPAPTTSTPAALTLPST